MSNLPARAVAVHPEQAPAPAPFASRPIPGQPSPFYVGERYVADAGLAARAQASERHTQVAADVFAIGTQVAREQAAREQAPAFWRVTEVDLTPMREQADARRALQATRERHANATMERVATLLADVEGLGVGEQRDVLADLCALIGLPAALVDTLAPWPALAEAGDDAGADAWTDDVPPF